ncbi:MAG: hypothetical protein ACT4NU_07720 [Chromatiales bacterium]
MQDRQMQLKMLLEAIDASHDGRITREEYVKYYENQYDTLDMHGAGVLSFEEMERAMKELDMVEGL